VLIGLLLAWHDVRRTLLAFVPAALVVAAAFFGTNYVAHSSWRPPYAHRSDGPVLARLESAPDALQPGLLTDPLRQRLQAQSLALSDQAELRPSSLAPDRWQIWDAAAQQRYAVVPAEGGLEIRGWDNWYEYEGSYWLPARKRGVDRGERSRWIYAFQILVGHRGILSLTPIWLFSVLGMGIWLVRGPRGPRYFAAGVVVLTLVCLAFYVSRPLEDRNYGGVAVGFRWMFWLIPLWLLCAVPAADAAARRPWSRGLAWGLLLISVLSASYAGQNPWSHSWIFDYWTHLGWLDY
jgi:hypothetical protein